MKLARLIPLFLMLAVDCDAAQKSTTHTSAAPPTKQAAPAGAQDGPPPLPTPEQLTELLHLYDVPGVALATLTRCEVDRVSVAGAATLEPEVPVTPHTVFEAASLSKPVFAYLVLTLADEGVIDLDRPIAETFAYPRIPDKAAYAAVTPRMVLTHRTGLPNWVDERTDFHERTAPVPFTTPPGAAYSYSGEAFQLLQAFVEHETGRTLQQLFRERLGHLMPRSTFAQPLPADVAPSRGYASASDPTTGRGMKNLYARGMAASSLITTAGDYARFLSHVCKRRGLRPDTYADMLRPQSPVPEGEAAVPVSYGLGWMLAEIEGETFVTHGGNNDEYRAFAGFGRASGDGLVVLTNGARGQALIDVLLVPPSPPRAASSPPEAVFEAFWAIYNEGYALFGVKHVDWDAVYRVYRPRVTAATTDAALWAVLAEIIDLLNDVHVTLKDPATGRVARSGGRSIGVGPFDDGTFSLALVEATYAGERLASAVDGAIRYGWLPDSIGYVHIRRFQDRAASAQAADTIVRTFRDASGLILDVRHNGGGDDRVGQAIASRFVAEPRRYLSVAARKIGQLPPTFTEPVTWWVRPTGPRQYTGPIILLVDSRSISAAENFALAMRVVPHAVVMGETTAGVMADVGTQPLPNGWQVGVPVNVFRDANGISWEGVGIPPDLYVTNDRDAVATGTDRILETAIAFLRAGAIRPRTRAAQEPAISRQ